MCFVSLNPEYAAKYIENPVKSLNWDECFLQYGGNFVSGGGRVMQNISAQFQKLRKIVILPYVEKAGSKNLNPIQSPFASEPGTMSAFTNRSMENLNVRIGSQNVFKENIQYSYQNYMQYVQQSNSINGGLTDGLTNGLISKKDWETSYGFVIINCHQFDSVNDTSSKQITISFDNNSANSLGVKTPMSYHVLVYYEKNMLLDVERGLVNQV